MTDKRKSKRHRKRFCVKFGVDAERRISFTKDISTDGLSIQTAHVLAPGTTVAIDLILEDDSLVVMEGLVRWARRPPRGLAARVAKGGMGIRIIKITEGADTYNQLCEELASR